MAVTQIDKETTMRLNVEIATDSFKNRNIQNVNPNLTDAKVYEHGSDLAALQSHSLNKIVRNNTATLESDE